MQQQQDRPMIEGSCGVTGLFDTNVTVTRQAFMAPDNASWQYVRTGHPLGTINSECLDIETVHRSPGGHLVFVCWRPYRSFHDPIDFTQYMETMRRDELYT